MISYYKVYVTFKEGIVNSQYTKQFECNGYVVNNGVLQLISYLGNSTKYKIIKLSDIDEINMEQTGD